MDPSRPANIQLNSVHIQRFVPKHKSVRLQLLDPLEALLTQLSPVFRSSRSTATTSRRTLSQHPNGVRITPPFHTSTVSFSTLSPTGIARCNDVLLSRDPHTAQVWGCDYLVMLHYGSATPIASDFDLRLVATLGLSRSIVRKVNRKDILSVKLPQACVTVTNPEAPLALRLQSGLLIGISR
jgi:hypothetical protein